jgi:hypothetical protein
VTVERIGRFCWRGFPAIRRVVVPQQLPRARLDCLSALLATARSSPVRASPSEPGARHLDRSVCRCFHASREPSQDDRGWSGGKAFAKRQIGIRSNAEADPRPATRASDPRASGSQRGSALRSAFCIRHARCRTWSISSTESYFVVARSGDVADPGVGGVALAAPNLQIPHLHATDRKIWNLELDLNGSSHH